MASSERGIKLVLAGSAFALGASMTATRASAQFACDLNGTDGGPNAADANAVGTAAQKNDNVPIGSMSSATDTHLLTVGALSNGDGAGSTVIGWEADAIANL
ncbi:MAG: hypothetical protein ABI667_03410 [Sphingomicrobium sp.]